MNHTKLVPLALAASLMAGCADMGSLSGPRYGEGSTPTTVQSEREGVITQIEVIKVPADFQFGIGTVAGAVAGGLLGSQVGSGGGRTTATVVGAAVGAAAGTVAESRLKQQDAHRVTVQMSTGGQLTITQPVDGRLRSGLYVRIDGSGDKARVAPR